MSAHDIKGCILKLNGVFTRLQGGSYTTSLAVKAALDITDEIDKHVDPLDSAMTKLRKQNCSFAKEIYQLTQEIAKLKQKNDKLERKLISAELELSQYSVEDLFASGEKVEDKTQTDSDKQRSPVGVREVEAEEKNQEKDIF